MVEEQIVARGVRDPAVIGAMLTVPRHLFVPGGQMFRAHEDGPLPLGQGQTISQPYIVAAMTEALRLRPSDRVLEIGTGSGYQTAILATLAREVFTVELLAFFSGSAQNRLNELGFSNIRYRVGDGHLGWSEEAPFDAILVAAAPLAIPPALVAQLAEGGRMVLPVGSPQNTQDLVLLVREGGRIFRQVLMSVCFVPLRGNGDGVGAD